jgi:hypothetical protein
VWWKEPRFRGSGAVVVLDDPVRDGMEIAGAGVGLPGDGKGWRRVDGGGKGVGEGVGLEGGVEKGLRFDEGEREGGFGVGEIERGEGGYTVRVVTSKGRKGKGKREVEREEVVGLQEVEVGSSVAATDSEAGSSDSDSGSECDLLFDFSKEEAKGWVPVMVAEEDEGDDWMSLTGSWVMMPGAQEAGK